MKKVKLLAIVSAVATALLLFLFLSSLDQPEETVKISVLVAASDIPADTPITAAMLKTAELPADAVVSGALADKSGAVGKVSKAEIYAGEQLLAAQLVSAGERGSRTLAYAIEPGMRAITISVGETASLAYMITPGDHVDILGAFVKTIPASSSEGGSEESVKISYTTMILENITVLAVDNVLSDEGKLNAKDSSYTTMTIQVTPAEAMDLSEALFEGEIRVILRSPVDTDKTGQPSVTLDDIMIK